MGTVYNKCASNQADITSGSVSFEFTQNNQTKNIRLPSGHTHELLFSNYSYTQFKSGGTYAISVQVTYSINGDTLSITLVASTGGAGFDGGSIPVHYAVLNK